jgi:hypothetical protein
MYCTLSGAYVGGWMAMNGFTTAQAFVVGGAVFVFNGFVGFLVVKFLLPKLGR